MPKRLPVLPLSLLLLSTACKKEELAAEAPLIGNWKQYKRISSLYDATGALSRQLSVISSDTAYLVITPTLMKDSLHTSFYSLVISSHPYTRQAKTLTYTDGSFSNGQLTIIKLTSDILALRWQRQLPTTYTDRTDMYYIR